MADESTDAETRLRLDIAEATRQALVDAALTAYDEAGLSGLCEEGRWEVAIGALRTYDVGPLLERIVKRVG
jgi:hypothetical protein